MVTTYVRPCLGLVAEFQASGQQDVVDLIMDQSDW